MPRLRTTTALSVLALAVGIAGTAWLSLPGVDLVTAPLPVAARGGHGVPATVARSRHDVPAAAAKRLPPRIAAGATRQPALPRMAEPESLRPGAPPAVVGALDERATRQTAMDVQTTLVPLSTPVEPAPAWRDVRSHLDGRVLLHVTIDGAGRVKAARVARSSGDGTLDARALRSVWLWRFAVPDGARGGTSGDVPVRYVAAR